MAISDAPSTETLKKLAFKRHSVQDDMVADYLAMVIKPGDKTLQIGASEFGSVFLQRGAFHQLVGNKASANALKEMCRRRAVRDDRLQMTPKLNDADKRAGLDAVLMGPTLGFSDLAGSWPQLANRLKTGGVLVLTGANRGGSARLCDTLMEDAGWALQEMIGSSVAIFRKTAVGKMETTRSDTDWDDRKNPQSGGDKVGLFSGVMRTLFGGFHKAEQRSTQG